MESTFNLKATAKEAQHLFDTYNVRLMEFKGNDYAECVRCDAIAIWKVVLRHTETLKELRGTCKYASLIKRLRNEPTNH